MNFYPESYDVQVTVPFTDGANAEVSPDSASAVLLDGDGDQIADLGVIDSSGVSYIVTVPGMHNSLPSGDRFAIRILEVSLVYPAGTIKRRFSYALEADVTLQLMNNSFMSYEYAFVVEREFVNTEAWKLADEGVRKTALIEAFNRLTRISMKWYSTDVDGVPIRSEENFIESDFWSEVDDDAFALFPTAFKRALRRAQFLEANNLLTNDDTAAKRRAGIIAETVGESSTRFSSSVLNQPLCSDAMNALAGFICHEVRIERA